MIAKITRGNRMGGLVRYLLGEGRKERIEGVEQYREPHEQQRVIATSRGVTLVDETGRDRIGDVLDVGRDNTGEPRNPEDHRMMRDVIAQLDASRAIYDTEIAGGHVWHLSLSNRTDDRELSDEQWADAVREVMERVGFDDEARATAPWVAFRHGRSAAGNDHVHVAVSLVREDGTKASIWRDRVKMSEACAEFERRFDLVRVDGRHAGSTPAPTRPEIEIAEREERPEPVRLTMARDVRAAAAASRDEAEFVRRLRGEGYRLRPRFETGDARRVVGYSVALDEPDARWWGGGKLAKDLTLPALREHWEPVKDQRSAWSRDNVDPGREAVELPDGTWTQAADRTRSALAETAERVKTGEVGWSDAARDGAAVAGALARRLEDRPGAIAASADSLARAAQQQREAARRRTVLDGVATVALQATRGEGAGAWVLVLELARFMETLQRVRAAEGQLHRASELQVRSRELVALVHETGPPEPSSHQSSVRGLSAERRPPRPPDRSQDWGR